MATFTAHRRWTFATVDDECFEDLSDVYLDTEIIELLLFATIEIGLDHFCIALELDTTERSPYLSELREWLTTHSATSTCHATS